MTLGGLQQGVTPLDMAHAYETFADRRQARSAARWARSDDGPVGIHEIAKRNDRRGRRQDGNKPDDQARSCRAKLAADRDQLLTGPVKHGTGGARAVRRLRRGQDRHDRELRRRLVRRLHRRAGRSRSGSATPTS